MGDSFKYGVACEHVRKTAMSKTRMVMIVAGIWALLGAYSAISDDLAKHVIAAEISGVVIDKESGKPIPSAVVALRFVRNNTGHSSPHCFRSMAVQADAQGRFRFAPWSQENTLANATYGEIVVHKPGYKVRPVEPLFISQSRRELLGIRFSNDIHIPKTEVRVELSPWTGIEEERAAQIIKIASDFTCHWQAYSDSSVLAANVLEEMQRYASARIRPDSSSFSKIEVLEHIVTTAQSTKNF